MSEYVDGEVEHLEAAISDLDELIARKHNWGVAYLLRSRVRSELAMENRKLDSFEEAIIDFEKAFEQLGGNSFTCSEGVHVYTRAMDLADHLDIEHPEWSARVDSLVSALRKSSQNNFGLSVAATFYATRGDFEKAREIEDALLPKIVKAEGVFTASAELYEHDKSRIPDKWANDTQDLEKQLCVALSLACSSPTEQEMIKIREFVDRLISTEPSVTWYALAIDIACVLGDHEMRDELCRAAKRRPTFDDEWRWWKRYIEFHCGDINERTFREHAEPFNHPLALVNYAIGLDALCNRDRPQALEYFEKVEKSVLVTTWDYHNAKVFKKKLENGWLSDEFQASK